MQGAEVVMTQLSKATTHKLGFESKN